MLTANTALGKPCCPRNIFRNVKDLNISKKCVTGDVSLRTGSPPPESRSSCSQLEQASLGNLRDGKIVGCGGFGKYLGKMCEDPKKIYQFFFGQITKKTRGNKLFCDCRYGLRLNASGAWRLRGLKATRALGPRARVAFNSASSSCRVNYTEGC